MDRRQQGRLTQPSSCNGPDATGEWVQELNKLGAEIDAWCDSLHPSAWNAPFVQEKRDAYRRLAKQDPEDG